MKYKILVVMLILLMSVSLANAQTALVDERIQALELELEKLEQQGFGTQFFQDNLQLVEDALNQSDTELAENIISQLEQRVPQAYRISDSLRALDLRIEDLEKDEVDVTRGKELKNKAEIAFIDERYDEAEDLLAAAEQSLEDAEAESKTIQATLRAARDNIVGYVQDNLPLVIAEIIITVVIIYIAYTVGSRKLLQREKERLSAEKNVVKKLMEKAQRDMYERSVIGERTYKVRMEDLQERLEEIEKREGVVNSRLRGKPKKTKEAQQRKLKPKK